MKWPDIDIDSLVERPWRNERSNARWALGPSGFESEAESASMELLCIRPLSEPSSNGGQSWLINSLLEV